MRTLKDFCCNESGVTAIEYGMIAALIATAGVYGFQDLGDSIAGFFGDVAVELDNAA